MICLRTFDTKGELLDVLEAAGLAGANETGRYHDASRVDVFELFPRVDGPFITNEPDGTEQYHSGWHVDTSAQPSWTANIAGSLTTAEYAALENHRRPEPTNPVRVFA